MDFTIYRSLLAIDPKTNLPISTNFILSTDGLGELSWQNVFKPFVPVVVALKLPVMMMDNVNNADNDINMKARYCCTNLCRSHIHENITADINSKPIHGTIETT